MPKFRKKPVVIEAWQFRTEKDGELLERKFGTDKIALMSGQGVYLNVFTLEGTHRANLSDWIIQGVHGELYPCKPDIFEKTYEPVQ